MGGRHRAGKWRRGKVGLHVRRFVAMVRQGRGQTEATTNVNGPSERRCAGLRASDAPHVTNGREERRRGHMSIVRRPVVPQ